MDDRSCEPTDVAKARKAFGIPVSIWVSFIDARTKMGNSREVLGPLQVSRKSLIEGKQFFLTRPEVATSRLWMR